MFDLVRNNKRLLQVLLVLIILPFAFFGIESYQRIFSTGGTVAKVDGSEIPIAEFAQAIQRQQDQLRAVLGREADVSILDTPQARAEILDGMISERLLAGYAARHRLGVTDDVLRELIASEDAFKENGVFSKSRYEGLLRAQNMTPASFEAGLRQDLAIRQLTGAIADSSLASRTVAEAYAAMRAEQREVAEAFVATESFLDKVTVAPEAVEQYYKAHPGEFETPEQVRVEYVRLTADAIAGMEAVPEDELRRWYDDHLAQYRREETRQASHILIAAEDPKARPDARKTAEAVLKQVREDPARFGDLAKKYSQDPGSAPQGGDLGSFARGTMVKPFEDAVFALKPGEVSDLVETEFGFHIIRLTEVKPGETIPFAEAKAGIERELRKQRAGRKFAEAAENFANIAYEQPDSLAPLVERFKLKPETSGWLARQGLPAEGPLSNPKLVAAIFSDEALKNRRNTEAVEVAPGTLVVARVLEHKPAVARPFEEVRAAIADKLRRDQAAAAAIKAAAEKLDTHKGGGDAGLRWGESRLVSRDKPAGLDQAALGAVFRADVAKLPAYVEVRRGERGVAILRVAKVVEAKEVDPAQKRAVSVGLARQAGAADFLAFLAALRGDAKIEVFKENLEPRAN